MIELKRASACCDAVAAVIRAYPGASYAHVPAESIP
jgi:hypothetical protein